MLARAALGAASTVLAACHSTAPDTGPPAAEAPTASISFYFTNWGLPAIYEYKEQRKVTAFQQRFPRIRVEPLPVSENYGAQLISLFAGGTPPTTFWADHQNVLSYAKQGFFDDLQPLAQRDRAFRRGDLYPQALEGCTLDKRLYALAGWAQANLIFFNADMFREANLPTPYDLWRRDRWTWEEHLTSALKLTRRDGPDGQTSHLGSTLGLNRLWMNTAGAAEYDDNRIPTRCLYDNPVGWDGLQYRNDLVYRHKVYDYLFTRNTSLDDTRGFLNRRVAMHLRWTTALDHYQHIATFKWGVAPYPKRTRYAADFTFWAYGLARGVSADQQTAGWSWLRFFTGDEGQRLEAIDMTAIPYTKGAQDVFTASLRKVGTFEHPEAIKEILEKYPFTRLTAKDQPEIAAIVNREIDAFVGDVRGVRDSCLLAAERANDYLRRNPQHFI